MEILIRTTEPGEQPTFYQQMTAEKIIYLHRNGERQWPEIEGAFWVEHFDGKFHAKEFFISEFNGKITCSDFQYLPSKARVYGPIPQPEIR